MSSPYSEHALQRASEIRIAVFDVDGVMTDGRLYYGEDGGEAKAFHTRDGLGLKGLMRHNIQVAVITARQSRLLARRAAELGIEHLMQGREDKRKALEELLARLDFHPIQAAYTGDDLVDWPAMQQCGLKCAPADATPWLRERADHVTFNGGGHGAVREVCELILSGHGLLKTWQESFR
jgi:3-deoxy-D-manno-octulosonate 8-phosphate phosphatase (KDO 8-P phosphatase)